MTRRTLLGLLPAWLLTGPLLRGRSAPSAVFIVPDLDELTLATAALGNALDELDRMLEVFDNWVPENHWCNHDRFEEGPLHHAYEMANEAEEAFLEVLRARGQLAVAFRGNLFVDIDQARAVGLSLDRWRSGMDVTEIPTIRSINDPW